MLGYVITKKSVYTDVTNILCGVTPSSRILLTVGVLITPREDGQQTRFPLYLVREDCEKRFGICAVDLNAWSWARNKAFVMRGDDVANFMQAVRNWWFEADLRTFLPTYFLAATLSRIEITRSESGGYYDTRLVFDSDIVGAGNYYYGWGMDFLSGQPEKNRFSDGEESFYPTSLTEEEFVELSR